VTYLDRDGQPTGNFQGIYIAEVGGHAKPFSSKNGVRFVLGRVVIHDGEGRYAVEQIPEAVRYAMEFEHVNVAGLGLPDVNISAAVG
jgi:hypothetical protein